MISRRPTTWLFASLLTNLLAAGCVTTRQPNLEQGQSPEPTATVGVSEGPRTAIDQEEAALDEDAIAELDDAEFCKDNVYAKYLRDEYLKANRKAVNPEKSFKPTGRRRRGVATRSPYDAREVEALYYARSRLVGESEPYFGAIPVVTNPRVEHWIRYFKNSGRKAFLRWLVRGKSVQNVVLPILKEQGLPPEFIFLSMVESGFSNSAFSHAKATGPWQFMPATARLYGLNMNRWIDERRDPGKSTLAAARLLSNLYQEFGDWYLAMAAYNAGSGRVRSAIRRSGSNNFWTIADSPYLPVETKNYVPKVLAALVLASNPSGHGFEVVADPLDVLPVSQVEVAKPASIREIAEKFAVSEGLIRHWNPELISSVTPPTRGGKPYQLRIAPHLTEKWSEVSEKLATVEVNDVLMHRIRRGETLASIARRYQTDIKKILNVNPGLKQGRLKIGAEVAVPTAYVAPKQRSSKARPKVRNSRSG